MIVAITGGTGFIGKTLVEKHLQSGDQVRILSRTKNLNNNVDSFIGDLTKINIDLSKFVDNVDVLYHCAGEINNTLWMYKLHIDGTERLINASFGKVKRWVQLSSVGAYGICREGIVTEKSIENPITIYERTKTESDALVRKSGIPYVIVRPSNVFGKGMSNLSLSKLLNMLEKNIFFFLGRPGSLVNYINVEDVARALILCGQKDLAIGNTYNISQSITVEIMIKSLLNDLDKKRKILRFPELPFRLIAKVSILFPKFPLTSSRIDALTGRCFYDAKKIENELGFKFNKKLEEHFKFFAKKK